jgi:hypothetical protein
LRVELTDHAPEFVALGIEEYECRCEFKAVYWREFHACGFLNVQADDVQLTFGFFFELVNDGLYRGAANSIGGLEFEQDGCACADHGLHYFRIIHQRGLARVKDGPCRDQAGNDDAEGEVVFCLGFVGKQDHPCDKNEQKAYTDKGILVGD